MNGTVIATLNERPEGAPVTSIRFYFSTEADAVAFKRH